jgi:hypothetical protein
MMMNGQRLLSPKIDRSQLQEAFELGKTLASQISEGKRGPLIRLWFWKD